MSLSKGYQSPSHASTQPMMSMTAVCGSSLSPVWNAIAVIARPSKVTGRPIRRARTPLRCVDRRLQSLTYDRSSQNLRIETARRSSRPSLISDRGSVSSRRTGRPVGRLSSSAMQRSMPGWKGPWLDPSSTCGFSKRSTARARSSRITSAWSPPRSPTPDCLTPVTAQCRAPADQSAAVDRDDLRAGLLLLQRLQAALVRRQLGEGIARRRLEGLQRGGELRDVRREGHVARVRGCELLPRRRDSVHAALEVLIEELRDLLAAVAGDRLRRLPLCFVQRGEQLIGRREDLRLGGGRVAAVRRLDLVDRVRDTGDRATNALGVLLVRNALRPGHTRRAEHEPGGEQHQTGPLHELPHETPLSSAGPMVRDGRRRRLSTGYSFPTRSRALARSEGLEPPTF